MAKKKNARKKAAPRKTVKKATPSKRAVKKKTVKKAPKKASRKVSRKPSRKPSRKAARKKRPPGRPKEPAITPANVRRMRILWIEGWTGSKLAEEFGISRNTVHHYLSGIRKESREEDSDLVEHEVERIRYLMAFAWGKIREQDGGETHTTIKDKIISDAGEEAAFADRIVKKIRHDRQTNWVGVVEWCIEQVCKLKGHYLTQNEAEANQEFRVAGYTRDEINKKAAIRFAEVVAEVRAERIEKNGE